MHTYRFHKTTAVGTLVLALLAATPLRAQVREVVSSRVAVSGHDATLHLDFTGGDSLDLSFRGGEVRLNGRDLGSYAEGGPLESSWRSLLGDAVALDDGRLARALVDWSPPSSLDGDARTVGRRVDQALEDALAEQSAQTTAPVEPRVQADTGAEATSGVAGLLRDPDRLGLLARALQGWALDRVQVHVDEDVTVAEGEEVHATLVVVNGDLEVRGTVDGDVALTGGTLTVDDGGRITGDVHLADARVSRNDGTVDGTVESVEVGNDQALELLRDSNAPDVDQLREEIRSRVRDELRSEMRDRSRGSSVFSPLRHVGRGLAGLIQNLVSLAVAVLLGMLAIRFFPENLDRVTEAARRNPVRAGMVGMAGFFLLLPAYILGMVALVVSIVGIPALLAWIPLFPLAAALAAAAGYLAAARILGEWIAEQGVGSLRPSNSLHTVAAGLGALILPFAAANVVQMAGPWLGFIQGLFIAVGWIAGVAACSVGFGAVLLTRGGREPAYPPETGKGEWRAGPAGDGPSGGGAPPPAEPGPEAEEAWTAEWEELERSARRRAREPGPGEGRGTGEAGPAEGESAAGSGSPPGRGESADREDEGESAHREDEGESHPDGESDAEEGSHG